MNKEEINLIKAIILSTGINDKNELLVSEENKRKAKEYELVKERCYFSNSEVYKLVEKNNILR